MKRYFFNVQDGRAFPDVQGLELSGMRAVRSEAVELACGVMNDEPADFWQGGRCCVEVTDNAGQTVFVLHFWVTPPVASEPGAD